MVTASEIGLGCQVQYELRIQSGPLTHPGAERNLLRKVIPESLGSGMVRVNSEWGGSLWNGSAILPSFGSEELYFLSRLYIGIPCKLLYFERRELELTIDNVITLNMGKETQRCYSHIVYWS